jgi:3',5'-cyclic-AMP phosphodiesterase
MPIHLPPISRRQFLRSTAAAAAGLVTLQPTFGATADADPHAFALLSDTHIPTDPTTKARNVNMADNLRSVIAQVSKLDPLPANALINGDCAYNKGLAGDYALFGQLVRPLREAGLPLHLTMGNHDDRPQFYGVYEKAEPKNPPVVGKFVSVVETARANFFLLDSLEKTAQTPGLLGAAQLAWLAKALDAKADKPAVVIGHHNPQFQTPANGTWFGIKDTAELFELLAPRKHVKAYVFGHSHHWEIARHEGIHLVNLPPVAYLFRAGDPNGYVYANIEPDGMKLELRCLDEKHPKHKERVELTWRA